MTMLGPASPPEREPWRAGAGVLPDGEASPLEPLTPELEALLDDPKPPAEPLHSIPHLRGLKRSAGALESLSRVILGIQSQLTQTLILRIATTGDPLKLWALHVELNKREIAPALRWPANTETRQTAFITIMADLLWLATKHPNHRPLFKAWRELSKLKPDSDEWHTKAFFALRNMENSNLSRQGAKGLALGAAHRQELMAFPTAAMHTARLELQPVRFDEVRQCLFDHAVGHPDKSGEHNPETVAGRNAQLYRVAVLLGHSPTAIERGWKHLTGHSPKRQVLSRRLTEIKTIVRNAGLPVRHPTGKRRTGGE
jgi:hypothetical protein